MSQPSDLTPSQWDAVDHFEGPLLVLAGPGSGKTRVITRRIARLIERGVPAGQILAITFTNKAAREMDARVQALMPGSEVWVSTFHRFCARLLRRYASTVGLQPNYTILDTTDQKAILKKVLVDLDIDPAHYSLNSIAHRISQAKNQMQSADSMLQAVQSSQAGFFDKIVSRIYAGYQQSLASSNAVDFDDLLLHVCVILMENPEIRAELDDRYRFILVDEYQDTNLVQYRIITALSQNNPHLCATGDPDQSIYRWRGAEIANILRFEADFPSARVVRLEQNYRSTKAILEIADRLIGHNIHRKSKALFTDNPEGDPVELLVFADEVEEANGIARTIRRLVHEQQHRWSDFAVFYRVNSLSRGIETALARQAIPCQVAAGVAFFERAEVKDLLAYLRLIFNPSDQTAFLRAVNTPPRGIGKTTQVRLAQWAQQSKCSLLEAAATADQIPGLARRSATALLKFARLIADLSAPADGGVAELLKSLILRTGFVEGLKESHDELDQQRLANISELVSAASQYDQEHPQDPSLEGFLEGTSLVADVDSVDQQAGKVTLMTLHAAKGLEFPVAFVVGVEQNLIPHQRAVNEGSVHELEEERRLLFVGMTRAEQRLFLTLTQARTVFGTRTPTIPSLFLQEMHLGRTAFKSSAATDFDPSEFDDLECGLPEDAGEDSQVEPPIVNDRRRSERRLPRGAARPAAPTASDVSSEDPESAIAPVKQPASRAKAASASEAGPLDKLRARLTTGAELLKGTSAEVAIPQCFNVGSTVRHPRFGVGQVIEAHGAGKMRIVTVEFKQGNRESFVASKSPLQPVGLS